jgi:hypothetical protein
MTRIACRPLAVLAIGAALALSIAPASQAASNEVPTLRMYLTWCQANDSACRADLARYVGTAVSYTAGHGGNPICAYGSREHWADYMLNWLRTQERRADEPAPDVFHDAVQAIYPCIR